jgi:hypothetical protein
MTSRLIPALALALLPAAASAQPLASCDRIEATSRPGMIASRGYEAAIVDGMVRRIVLTLANNRRSTTDFSPMGDGISVRLTTFADQQDPSRVTAVFNRAEVGPGGMVKVETWVRQPGAAQPAYNFYRIRCSQTLPHK